MKNVSDIITAHHAEILGSWIRGAADSHWQRRLTQRELAGSMPEYLASLGRTAAGSTVQLAPGQMRVIGRHLAARAHHGFTRNEVLAEIALLGRCISRILDSQPGPEGPPPEEVRQLLAELYLTSLAVASTFDASGPGEEPGADQRDPETAGPAEPTREPTTDAVVEGQLRERFVSVLTHDLSGPLDAAQANATTLLDRTAGDAHRAATNIVSEIERMREMLAALVDAHRVRVGQPLQLQVRPCDLGRIAADAVYELRTAHGERVSLQVDGRVHGVWDPGQLRRAIGNLIRNALEHGAIDRPVRVAVAATPDGAQVTVHNEGPAIPAADQQRLFRWFVLPGAAVQGPRHGWRLGMILVWGCVEAHGGQVSVDSRPEHGTTFRILLPSEAGSGTD